jgi:hypothetical protein
MLQLGWSICSNTAAFVPTCRRVSEEQLVAHSYYACNGFCNRPDDVDPRYGLTEVVLYNPGAAQARVDLKIYLETDDPLTYSAPILIEPRTNELLVMPELAPAIFEDCKRWGVRYRSTQPLLINSITLDGISHADAHYQGGVQSVLATQLHRDWLYADGVLLDWTSFYGGDTQRAPFPFNELEHYYFLNPNLAPAKLTIKLHYRNLEPDSITLEIPAQRLLTWTPEGHVPVCEPFGVSIHSDCPIATSYVRYIYGLHGIGEWGMHVHFAQAGTPAYGGR